MSTKIRIDFNNREEGEERKILKSETINISPNLSFWGDLTAIQANFHKIAIENIVVPPSLIIKGDSKKLVQIEFRNQKEPFFSDFRINSRSFSFTIVFDASQIIDYNDFTTNEQVIIYDLVAEAKSGDKERGKEQRQTREIPLSFIKGAFDALYSFELDSKFQEGIFYEKLVKPVIIGLFKIKNRSKVLYRESLKATVSLSTYRPDYGMALSFGEINPELSQHITLSQNFQELVIADFFLPQEEEIFFPVCLDFTRIANPVTKNNCLFKFNIATNNRFKLPITFDGEILLKPDTTKTELLANFYDGKRIINLKEISSKTYLIPSVYRWNKEQQGERDLFVIELGNVAINQNNTSGYLEINDLEFKIIGDTKTSPPPDEFLLINGKPMGDLEKSQLWKDGMPILKLAFSFKNNSIKEIKDHVDKIRLKLVFNYSINSSMMLPFEFSFIFNLEEDPGRFWLAIDFGTSAIVVAYNDSRNSKQIDLLNLKESLLDYDQNAENGANYEEQDTEYFLSSKMILRNRGKIISGKYEENLVYISPSIKDLQQNYLRLIPYLKSLIGNQHLSNAKNRLNKFEYYVGDELLIIDKEKDNRIEIEDLLKSAYYSLINHYIRPLLGEKGKSVPHKIILTVPNTFNYLQYSLIKNLISVSFGDYFWKNQIVFITESESVAYNYLYNKDLYKSSISTNQINNETLEEEHVFVYDMGAGTLDITYFKLKKNSLTKENKVEKIIGNMGITSAGNYLDYLIAIAILDQIPEENKSHYKQIIDANKNTETDANLLSRTIELKRQISSNLKSALSSNQKVFSLSYDDSFPEQIAFIDLETLISHYKIVNYINMNSETLIENFFSLFAEKDESADQNNKIPLDTVIFTGRGSQFPALRKAVKDAIGRRAYSVNGTQYVEHLDSSTLKSVVVEGALLYARSLREAPKFSSSIAIYAKYGVLYRNYEEWRFLELLNKNSLPYDPSINDDGVQVLRYFGKGIIDLSQTYDACYFVQSFSKDTTVEWNSEHTSGYIIKLFEFNRDEVVSNAEDYANVEVSIEIKGNPETDSIEMLIKIGNLTNDPRKPIHFETSEGSIFQQSMWPFIV